ncbi:MAG: hypothetical protein V1820_01800 [archaeon]
MKPPRIYAFDSEGTLTTHASAQGRYPSDWPLIANALGPACLAEEDALTARWNEQQRTGELLVGSYIDFMRQTIEIHRMHGLTEEVFAGVLASVPFIGGVEETFRGIKEANPENRIAIISGGFENRLERLPGISYVDEIRAACKYRFDPETGLLCGWDLKEYDYAGKVTSLREIAKKYGIPLPDGGCFTGDGRNDSKIMEAVSHRIALNAHPELVQRVKELGGVSVETNNLRDVLPYLDL